MKSKIKSVMPIAMLSATAFLTGCATTHQPDGSITASPFGKTAAGSDVELYTLQNGRGMEAQIATYGGIVTRLTAPDRNGRFADVVLG